MSFVLGFEPHSRFAGCLFALLSTVQTCVHCECSLDLDYEELEDLFSAAPPPKKDSGKKEEKKDNKPQVISLVSGELGRDGGGKFGGGGGRERDEWA